jgi:hypothetical protein
MNGANLNTDLLGNKNIYSYTTKVFRCGSSVVTIGIVAEELSILSKKHIASLQAGEVLVSGERVTVNGDNVTAGAGDYMIISNELEQYGSQLVNNPGNTIFNVVSKESDIAYVLPLKVNDNRIQITMRVNENVVVGDKLKYDIDNLSLVKANSGDTALFVATSNGAQYDGVVVTRINEVIS